ncbi:hypothetical protein P8452_46810 [Trifolium repens]|nr:hypothetical protein P8452_46810 [Trifolium repens]
MVGVLFPMYSSFNHEARFGSLWLAFGAYDLTLGLGLGLSLNLELIVLNLPQTKLLSASRRHNVLHTYMNSLPQTPERNTNKHKKLQTPTNPPKKMKIQQQLNQKRKTPK